MQDTTFIGHAMRQSHRASTSAASYAAPAASMWADTLGSAFCLISHHESCEICMNAGGMAPDRQFALGVKATAAVAGPS